MINVMGASEGRVQFAFMIHVSEKENLRKRLIRASIMKLESLIDDFKGRIEELRDGHDIGNEESYDSSDQAANTVKALEINSLNQALEFAIHELKILEHLNAIHEMEYSTAVFGAIVVTNHGAFFIASGIEQLDIDGDAYFGISTKSAIYQAMHNRKKGDVFNHQGTTYKIEDVF